MPLNSRRPQPGILSAPYVATTLGTFALIVFVAFESLAVVTVMPGLATAQRWGADRFVAVFVFAAATALIGVAAARRTAPA